MKKRRNSKAKNQTFHFKKRCDERLGTQIDRKALQRRIREHNFDENFYVLNKQSNRVTRYRYKFQDKWYIIPYDKNTHKVITIFPDRKQELLLDYPTEVADNNIENNSEHWYEKLLKLFKSVVVKWYDIIKTK